MAHEFVPFVSASGVGHPRLSLFGSATQTLFGARKRAFKAQVYICQSPNADLSSCVRALPCSVLQPTRWAHGLQRRFGGTDARFFENFDNTYAVAISSELERGFKREKFEPTLDFEAITGDGSLCIFDTNQPLFMYTNHADDGDAPSVYHIQAFLLSVRKDNKTGWLQIETIRELEL
jgi:hypothetical protein